MGISARKVHDYDLFSGHAWYVPGVTGMFGLIAWFLLGSLLGGILGILLGHGASLMIAGVLGWPIEASPQAIVAAVIVSATVGILFGFYPAWKASRLDPIEALRYE